MDEALHHQRHRESHRRGREDSKNEGMPQSPEKRVDPKRPLPNMHRV